MTSSLYTIFDLLSNYLEDPEWSHIDIVALASCCKSAQVAFSKTLQWSKEHRWRHYRITCEDRDAKPIILDYKGMPITVQFEDTYLNQRSFRSLMETLVKVQHHPKDKNDPKGDLYPAGDCLYYINSSNLCCIPTNRSNLSSDKLCKTVRLLTDLSNATHRSLFITQILTLAAYKYRNYRLAHAPFTPEEHVELYRSMMASKIKKPGPCSYLNIYINIHVLSMNYEFRVRRFGMYWN